MKNSGNLLPGILSKEIQDSFYHYLGILPNPDKILRSTGKTLEAYRDLKNDPHLWSCIQSRKSGLLSLPWSIIPQGASQSVTIEIESMLRDIDLHALERDILEAPLFGYQPLEIIWAIKGDARKFIIPQSVLARPQEWFFFDTRGSLRLRSHGDIKGQEPPPMKIICARYEPDYSNPYGHSLLSKCYWPVKFKNGSMKFWINFTEKYGMPLLMARYSRGGSDSETQKIIKELNAMTQDTVIVAPNDIDVQLHESQRWSSSNLYRDLIKYCNSEISKAILSQTLTTELDMGSYAAAQTHYKIRREVIQSDVRLVEWSINQLVKFIVALNFHGSASPRFNIIMNDSDNTQKIDRDVKITQTGSIRFTKKYWMDTYGLKEEEIEETA